jgi:uncharacterized membrane protein YuzA (DUF378 family)
MKKINVVACILLIIGGLNWGVIGVAKFNFIAAICGEMEAPIRIIYILVGLAAVLHVFQWKKMLKCSRK